MFLQHCATFCRLNMKQEPMKTVWKFEVISSTFQVFKSIGLLGKITHRNRSRWIVLVQLAKWLPTGRTGMRFPVGESFLCLAATTRPTLGAMRLPIDWVLTSIYSAVKRREFETDLSPPSCAEARNKWSFTSISNMSSWWSAQTFSYLLEYTITHL